jgi:hypothetical protein
LRRLIALLTIVLLATMANTSVAAAQVTDTVAPAAPAPIVWHELTFTEPAAPVPPTTTTIPGTTTTTTTIDPALGTSAPSPSVPPGSTQVSDQTVPVPSTPPVEPTTTTTTTTLPPTTTTLRKPGKPGLHGHPRPGRPDAVPTTTEPRAGEEEEEEEEPGGATTTTEPFTMEPDVTTGEPPSPPPADPPHAAAARALPDPGITSLSLPYTGLDPRPVLALAFGLVAGGGLLSWRARRRPRHARGQ